MNQDLQKYLDGELPLDALQPDDRVQAERWTTLLADARSLHDTPAPIWLETRVMATLPARPRGGWRNVLHWLTDPRPVRVRPVSIAAAVVATAIVLILARPQSQPAGAGSGIVRNGAAHAVTDAPPAIIYVQFVFANPAAKTVTVAGDFNAWDVAVTPLRDTDGDGVWTGRVALRPGLHKYMFVVDGETWVTDPQADTYVDDGFGMRNAVLTVAQPSGRAI